ncbi:hypothetical protein ACM257_17510 [Alteromonas macleodii]|uniref:hypothetical protein n=1 Tax=Alteromonas macleodii TaxID=28108 RepID=UPI0039F6A409
MKLASAKSLVAAMAVLTGSKLNHPEPLQPKEFLNSSADLKVKTRQPVNGYQAKQRKRKLKRRGGK